MSEYIIEYIAMGSYMKVTAIDPLTGREVSIVGDASAPRNTLANLAIKKMEYVLSKQGKK